MEGDGQNVLRNLRIIQSMLDISADRLTGLRTQCSTSVELTQREIRTIEGKLLKLFSKQMAIKIHYKDTISSNEFKKIPSLHQWLQVVGLCQESIQSVVAKVKSVEALQEKSHAKLKNIITNCLHHDEEVRKLTIALHNLKRYTDILLKSGKDVSSLSDLELSASLDSWDWSYISSVSSSSTDGSEFQDSSSLLHLHHNGAAIRIDHSSSFNNPTKSYSNPVPPLSAPCLLSPPLTPIHKYQLAQKSPSSISAERYNYSKQLVNVTEQSKAKSKSHDSHLFTTSSIENYENGLLSRRGRLSAASAAPALEHISPTSSQYSSPTKSPPFTITSVDPDMKLPDTNSIDNNVFTGANIGSCPRTPEILNHSQSNVPHKFTRMLSFGTECNHCHKIIINGLKCKECRVKLHRNCAPSVLQKCPTLANNEFVFENKRGALPLERESPNLGQTRWMVRAKTATFLDPYTLKEGGNSAPSSPRFLANSKISSASVSTSGVYDTVSSFTPSSSISSAGTVPRKSSTINTSMFSNGNLDSNGGISDPDKIVNREDSQDSNQTWDGESDKVWPRQYSVSMKEWEIPWDELTMGDKLGTGRFGTVYRGYWHGDVAIKLLNMDCLTDQKVLKNFKSEVCTFRKTRHANLILFMGACMKPPRLAIVTSMVHGMTLYQYLHLRKEKFSMRKTTVIAQQITQGMGYLHAKGIVHKDLRTKNIFLENEKVLITDFGLFSVTKLCFKNKMQNGLVIPPGWLCYLSPEIIRNLRSHVEPGDEHLPFSFASDIYAFGTVWYELLCSEMPFSAQNPESIIWQVGKGMKQSLANLEASRDVKDILMRCWSYQMNKRPNFTILLDTIEKLPKKRLARSPSHPVHLSRSAESMF